MKKKGNEKEWRKQYMARKRKQKHYQKYSERYNKKITDKRHAFKRKIVELKGNKCFRCGGRFDDECYDLHHIEPGEKDLNIAKALTEKTWIEVEKEIEKCILVCANCHRTIHKEEKYSHLKENKSTKITIQIDLFEQ